MRFTAHKTMEAKPKPAATGRGSTIHDNSSLKEMLSKPNGFQMSLRRRSSSSSVLRMPPLPTAFFQIDSAAASSSIHENDTATATSSLLTGTTTSTNTASLALQFLDGNKLEEEEEEALEEEEEKEEEEEEKEEEEEEAEGEEASLCSDSCSISSRSETMMELETAAGPDTVIDQVEEEEEEEKEEEEEEEPSSSSDSCSRSRSGLKRAEPDAVVDQEEEEEEEEETEAKQAIIDPVMIEDNAVDLSPTVSQEGTEEAEEEEARVLAPLSKKAKTTTTINNTNSTCMMKATPSSSATSASTKLDHIDLDHITVNDLQGLRSEDGDVLRAKQFHQLSKREREHVLYDIHGVADSYNTTTDTDTTADVTADDVNAVDSSLVKDLRVELTNELMRRKKKMNKDEKKNNGTTPTATEGTKSNTHEGPQDDDVVTATIATAITATTTTTTTAATTTDDSNSSNKDDYLGNIFKMDYPTTRSSHRNSAATNALFSIPSGLFSDSSSNNNATLSLTSAYAKALATTAQCDAALLDSASKATAYEQALAQCRGRRRERNNSLFRDDTDDDAAAADDDDEHIDVESSEFLTSFLQCEEQRFENEKENDSTSTSTATPTTRLLQVRKAACRILDYFEEKKTLFGVDLLTTRIQFQTLDHETQQLLESGCIQLLSEHDRAGRAVIVGTKKLVPDNNNNTAVLRAFWFLSSVALEDREIETKGIVFVYYTLGGTSSIKTDTEIDDQQRQRCVVAKWGNVLQALPLRVASIHWCVENNQEETATNLSALLLGRSNFVRVRCHRGTDSEVQYQLMTFGIPTQLFPIQMNGEVNVDNVCLHVRDFVQQRKMVEQEGHSHLLNKALAVLDDSSSSPLLSSTILNLNDCIALVEGEDENDDIDTDVDTVCSTGGESVLINTSIFSPNNLLVDDNTSQHHHHQQQQQHADQNNICGIPFNDMFLLNNNNNSMNMNMNTSNNGRPSNNHHHHHHLMQYPPAALPPLSSLSTSSLEYHLYQQQQQQQRHHQQQQLQQEKQLLVRQLQKHQQELRLQAEKQILVNQLQKQQQELGQLMESQQQHHLQQQQLQSSSTSPTTTTDPATISPTISPPPTESSTKKGGKKTNKSTTIVEDPEVDIVPGETDILLGRGRGAQNHKGNIHYRHVVETFRKQYEEIPNKGEKTLFIREVVDIIYDNGGQFLKKNPNGSGKWVRINPDVAREKVSHSFRNAKRLEGYEKAESN